MATMNVWMAAILSAVVLVACGGSDEEDLATFAHVSTSPVAEEASIATDATAVQEAATAVDGEDTAAVTD